MSQALMKSLLNLAKRSLRRAPLTPLQFPSTGFAIVKNSDILEEEQFDEFRAGKYYPVNIGDVYASRYQVLGKLGFGTTSTVWLARNLQEREYVALKVFGQGVDQDEFEMYAHLGKANSSHLGHRHVRTALDTFRLQRGDGEHHCLVQKPMWDSWRDVLSRNPSHRFTEDLLKAGLYQLFLALDYLHTECRLVHTDLKGDNILQELVDQSVLEAFTNAELKAPSDRKFVDGTTVYASRRFDLPGKFGHVVLSDFGSAVRGDKKRNHDAQPDVYRSPEIWDLFEGRHLFYGHDLEKNKYTTRAHLAEVVGLLGSPPPDLVQRGARSMEFFTADGEWKADVQVPQDTSLEDSVTRLEGEKKEEFLAFVRGMLQWRPEDRKTAAQLLNDPWLRS